ncbi:MAG: GntR family transcriptional regulator [Herbinix sp.]|nr:GntR family transcriptional regulator [Herbinix sp.]
MVNDKRLQYEKAIDEIEEYIDLHGLKEYEALPSERALADILKISRGTVREAIEQMCQAGRLYTIHGKGSFISPNKEYIEMQQMISFSGAALEQKKVPGSKLISFKEVPADSTIAKLLSIDKGEVLYVLTRVRSINLRKISLEISHIPKKYCLGLENHIETMDSLYHVLENVYGVHMVKQDIEVRLSKASKIEANYLAMEYMEPIFVEEAVAYTDKGIPFEYTKTIVNTNNTKYINMMRAED